MVDKNVAYNRDGRSAEFDENDPLAELARIVGYEDRPRHVSPPAASAASVAQRRDPSFNLEDELLREFAIYDAPRDEVRVAANDAVVAPAEPIHANDFLQRVEDVFARREPEFAPQPEPQYQDDFQIPEAPIGDALRYTMNAQPQTYGDEIYSEPQYVEPVYQEPAYAEPQLQEPLYAQQDYTQPVDLSYEVEQSLVEEPVYQAPQPVAEPLYAEPAYVEPTYVEPIYAEPVYEEPVYQPQAVTAPQPEFAPQPVAPVRGSQGARSSLEFSSMRQPLGNFSMSRATPFIPKTPPVSQTPVHVPVQAEPIMAPVASSAPVAFDKHSDLDALIADVSRYSIGTTERSPVAVAARQEPVAAVQAEPAFDLNDDAFEAALDEMDFEFDLSDIDLSDPIKAHIPAPARGEAKFEPAAKAVPAQIPPRVAPAPAETFAAASFTAPAQRPVSAAAPLPAAPAAPQGALPFDLDQIGDTEDHPETLSDFDVPELPPLHVEPKATAQRHDDDLELDTELAALFTPSNPGFDRSRAAGEKAAAAAPAPKAPDVDEFERALEEDFRRSLQENPTKPTKIQTNPADSFDDFEADAGSRPSKRWMMPAIAAVGALVVVGGVYAAFFGGSSTVTGSDGLPVVIAADNEPMKVVPAEPGGRVVPNQDKAVYDRVQGNASSDPKQPALISSDEQPVDVVQHTLIPEQVAIDDEGDFPAGGEALDTVDPRLLPQDEQAQAVSEAPVEAPVNVSPRRVRTMIVKPDGTLVAQEVDAPAAPAPTAVVQTQAQTPAPVVAPVAQVPAPEPQPVPVATRPAAPEPTPAPAPAPVIAAPVTPEPAPAVPAPAPAATNTASSGGYYIQIASLPSDAEAQKTYKSMSSKFGSVIGGRGVDIKRADIAGKGTYYRVRIPAGDRAEANALCQRFQSAGGSCLVTR